MANYLGLINCLRGLKTNSVNEDGVVVREGSREVADVRVIEQELPLWVSKGFV